VPVDLAAVRERLMAAGEADLVAWEQIRALLRDAVGESTFEIWLERLELIAVDLEGTLIVAAPAETLAWVGPRFGRVLDAAAQRADRGLRIADEVERRAAESLAPDAAGPAAAGFSADARRCRVAGSAGGVGDVPAVLSDGAMSDGSAAGRADRSPRKPTYTSAYPTSYSDVYTHTREVS
jgi:hypothetical protein